MRKSLNMLAICLLAGCATPTSQIRATYVSEARYVGMDCPSLLRLHDATDAEVSALSSSQDGKALHDTIMVGAALFVPLAVLGVGSTGPNMGAELSRLMGERDALQRAAQAGNCAEVVPPGAAAE